MTREETTKAKDAAPAGPTPVSVEHCLGGRLTEAYPVARHDLELRLDEARLGSAGAGGIEPAELTGVLARESARLLAADPQCRKVVYAAPAGDLVVIAAAEEAGFRYVVDVDLPGGEELSLLVREPGYVTQVDMGLDRVPGV